ncbi:branched-chain amino acid ABC transporter permease [Deferrisoma camini]|uniref:branched-chain amino acid ABC transporter permease n=1 Tax=Deferrisoma camini TaxID=1035120 RepID=UPI00046D45AA|nr:branched-chain amino acid ABC transporter permease [Deferrisoma camini]
MKRLRWRWWIGAAAFVAVPFGLDSYALHVAITCLFYAMMATSWNLIAGYTGQVSFAHAAFAGIGAYTSGLLAVKAGVPPWIGIAVGTAAAGAFGLMLGVLCLRMGGIYLSLATLAFSEILSIVVQNEYEVTRGTMGLQIPGLLPTYSKLSYYFVFLAAAVGTVWLVVRLIRSDLGLSFRAVQNDEAAAAASGVDVVRIRVLAFTVSSALAGLAGGLFGHYLLLITPTLLSLDQMFLVLAMAVIGGLGSLWGPVAGAFFLEILSEYIRAWGEYHVLAFGLVALVVARFAPDGLAGLARAVRKGPPAPGRPAPAAGGRS